MKVLASDLDGTLYFSTSDEKIKPQDIRAIKDFQAAGNLFGICSGRTYAGIRHALDGMDVHLDFYILVSGACLMTDNGKIIYQYRLSKEIIDHIVKALKDIDVSILFCHEENYYRLNPYDHPKNHEVVIDDVSKAPFESYDSLHLAFKEIETLTAVKTLLEKKFSKEIAVHHNVLNLDITPANHSKGQAIKCLPTFLGCSEEDISAIGDSFNDMSMLEAAKTSFTFHRSDKTVQASAKYIVDDIAEAIHFIQGEKVC